MNAQQPRSRLLVRIARGSSQGRARRGGLLPARVTFVLRAACMARVRPARPARCVAHLVRRHVGVLALDPARRRGPQAKEHSGVFCRRVHCAGLAVHRRKEHARILDRGQRREVDRLDGVPFAAAIAAPFAVAVAARFAAAVAIGGSGLHGVGLLMRALAPERGRRGDGHAAATHCAAFACGAAAVACGDRRGLCEHAVNDGSQQVCLRLTAGAAEPGEQVDGRPLRSLVGKPVWRPRCGHAGVNALVWR
eukprot:364350-Chlamydomonas_euryale.AAC.1